MKRKRYERLLEKAIYAAMAAIDTYNRILFPYKQEAFAILMTNAWELLLKAKWVQDNGNDYRSLFERTKNGRYKRNRSGNEITYVLTYLLNQMRNAKEVPENVYNNLLVLIEIRDNAVHLYVSPHLRERIHSVVLATARNFYLLSTKWFGKRVTESLESAIIQPVSFAPPDDSSFSGFKSEERLFRFLQRLSESQEDDSDGFFVTAEVRLKFVRSKRIEEALPVRMAPGDPNALPLELTEEQWRERYPWTYQELVRRLRERYEDFKQNWKFYDLKGRIEPNPSKCTPEACYNQYCRIRFLDPLHPNKSSIKKFYSSAVLGYFDQFYTKKERNDNIERSL